MSKKVITETSDMEFNIETGKYEVKRTQQVAVLATEDKYYKFYYEGLSLYSIRCHFKYSKKFSYFGILYFSCSIMQYSDTKEY